MQKAKKCCCSSSWSHFLFPRDFSGTTADTDIVNAPLEPLRSTDLPVGGQVTETNEWDEFLPKMNENKNKCRPVGLVDSA